MNVVGGNNAKIANKIIPKNVYNTTFQSRSEI